MRPLLLAAAAAALVSFSAHAAEKPVPKAELQKLIVGKTVTSGNAYLSYGADGRYTYNNGNFGNYRIENGRICINFDAGGSRCDSIVSDGSQYFLVNRQGQRYSFKP
ncbi:hypothetical protein [Bosea sp. BH3]|uniref:hypothetical protein n=1 Tax=Bosea sp. BH3 TaxID=2871701 RepID=UPI0021CB543A|nr:hypothetical protein [Bosea sp. BH3]MCU4182392.1 hypothetical protein [Bosea sp. BH3]